MNKLIFLFIGIISLVGCKSSIMTGVEPGTLVCMLNEEEWVSTSVEVTMTMIEEQLFGISAIRAGGGHVEQLNMRIIGFKGEGTYDVLESTPRTTINFERLGGKRVRYDAMQEGVQKIVITDFDETAKTISGTFECLMLGDKVINPIVEHELHLEVKKGRFNQLPIIGL